jgi:single stranded DNA-binding protein
MHPLVLGAGTLAVWRPSKRAEKDNTQMNFNQITLIGFIGKDAETKALPNSGRMVTKFSVATAESWKDDQGEWQTRTQWHTVIVIWNRRCLSTVSCF